jgi:mannose-6-phosphate isomerase-like protein (cupin superfamily)
MKAVYREIAPYTTKDGSEIREFIHPDRGGSERMSLAEATVLPGSATILHVHRASEEIYHKLQGRGIMTLGGKTFEVSEGDSILIRPGVPHRIENSGEGSLKILCCCSPPYSHGDTGLLG